MNTVSKYDVADILMHISADKVHNPGLEGPTNGVFAAILDKVEKNHELYTSEKKINISKNAKKVLLKYMKETL